MTPIQKWQEAHPGIAISDEALAVMAPFPSLYANDFITFVEGRGDDPRIVDFVRGIHREMVWAYGNWDKAQRDGDAARLLADLINGAKGGPEYEFVGRFLNDYAKANNISVPVAGGIEPSWFAEVKEAAE